MNSVNQMLGLHAEADESSAMEAISALQNRVAELEPFEQQNELLQNRIAEHDAAEIDLLIAAKGIAPDDVRAEQLKPVLLKMENRDDRVSFLDACVTVEKPVASLQNKLTNRTSRGPSASAQPDSDKASASRIGAVITQIRNRDKCSIEVAMAVARAEKPELFV